MHKVIFSRAILAGLALTFEKDGALYYTDARIRGLNTYSGDKTGVLSADFPKGFRGVRTASSSL